MESERERSRGQGGGMVIHVLDARARAIGTRGEVVERDEDASEGQGGGSACDEGEEQRRGVA